MFCVCYQDFLKCGPSFLVWPPAAPPSQHHWGLPSRALTRSHLSCALTHRISSKWTPLRWTRLLDKQLHWYKWKTHTGASKEGMSVGIDATNTAHCFPALAGRSSRRGLRAEARLSLLHRTIRSVERGVQVERGHLRGVLSQRQAGHGQGQEISFCAAHSHALRLRPDVAAKPPSELPGERASRRGRRRCSARSARGF